MMNETNRYSIEKLPEDILLHIFSFVNDDYFTLRRVCAQWRYICKRSNAKIEQLSTFIKNLYPEVGYDTSTYEIFDKLLETQIKTPEHKVNILTYLILMKTHETHSRLHTTNVERFDLTFMNLQKFCQVKKNVSWFPGPLKLCSWYGKITNYKPDFHDQITKYKRILTLKFTHEEIQEAIKICKDIFKNRDFCVVLPIWPLKVKLTNRVPTIIKEKQDLSHAIYAFAVRPFFLYSFDHINTIDFLEVKSFCIDLRPQRLPVISMRTRDYGTFFCFLIEHSQAFQ